MRPLRILSVLGQRPGFTGSGILVQELWKCAVVHGDLQRLICAGYADDDWCREFGHEYSVVTCSQAGCRGNLPFPVPGMSDVMPYPSVRYCDLSSGQVKCFISQFRRVVTQVIREFRPDLLHIHHLWALTDLWRVAKRLPCFVTVHGTDLKLAKSAGKHRHLAARNINEMAHYFCVSKDMAADAANEYGIESKKMSILGNGYNPEIFKDRGSGTNVAGKIVLCAGKFVGWKGFRFAIRASAEARTPHQLVILGTGAKEERANLLRHAEECGVKVLFPGHVSHQEVARWMRRADVFVLPSIHEPFGMVLLEAMACGCRVVASASGGPKDIISRQLLDLGFAHLIPPLMENVVGDKERYVRDLAKAILLQLKAGQSEKVRVSIATSVAGMTWASVYKRMRSKYCELITQTPGNHSS